MADVLIEGGYLGYISLFEKHAPPGVSEEQAAYQAEVILDPVANAAAVQAIQAAYEAELTAAGKPDFIGKIPSPLRDGSRMNVERETKGQTPRPEIEGKLVLNAKSKKFAVPVVDAQMLPIGEQNRDKIFSGCRGNIFVRFYWWPKPPTPGVYVGLQGVQLVSNVDTIQISGGGVTPVTSMFHKIEGAPAAVQPESEGGPSQSPWG